LSVASEPPGADVNLDGTVRGRTPLVFSQPRGDGEVRLVLRLAGYKDKTRAVKLKSDAVLSIDLERAAPPEPTPPKPRPEPERKPVKPLDGDGVLQPNF